MGRRFKGTSLEGKIMSRTALNAAIDAVAYAGFVFLGTTGLMLRYQLPPGSGRMHGMGSGAGAAGREITTVWGFTRHEWGSIHYWAALGLLAILAVHLILHWKWIICVLRGRPHSDVSGRRFALGVAGLLLVTLLALSPLATSSQTSPRSQLVGPASSGANLDAANAIEAGLEDGESLRGFMTLDEVAQRTGMPVKDILERLGLPGDTAASERVGRLLRAHGLEMAALRQAVGQEGSNR
jgi:hypothetical protein